MFGLKLVFKRSMGAMGELRTRSAQQMQRAFVSEYATPTSGEPKWESKDALTSAEMAAKPITPEQMRNAAAADARYRSSHMEVEAKLGPEDFDMVRRKRMIYRSKQRGWLEADLLLGTWAVENVPHLTPAELDEYEVLLKVETIDIYNYVSGKDALPPYLAELGVMQKLQAYAKRGNMNSPEGYKKMKEDANLT